MPACFGIGFGSGFDGQHFLVPDPGGLPPGAIAYADFKNGTYYYGGNALSDLFVENTDWASFDPAGKVVPDVGYVGDGNADGPTLASALAAEFLSAGYTFVANVASIGDGASFGSDFVALPDYDPDVSVVVNATGLPTVNSSVAGDPHSTPYRIAATLSPTRAALAINGGSAIEDTYTHTGFTHVVLSFNASVVEDITFYPPKNNTELAALSAG